jgi:hypothetical protein
LLTAIALLGLTFGGYNLLYYLVASLDFALPLNIGSLVYNLILVSGSILLLAKRKIGIYLSLASIVIVIGFQIYWQSTLSGYGMYPAFLRSENLSSSIPMIAIPLALLIIGWKKVRWQVPDPEE